MSAIDEEVFLNFSSRLVINSKDLGLVPLHLSTTQLFLLRSIVKGLEEGKHHFVVLKCRQAQASTLALAFCLYWSFRHEGMNGMLITEKNENRLVFRATVGDFIRALPEGPEWRQPVLTDNRDFLSFGNRSRLIFANANARDRGGLGRGLGLSLVHGTEVSRWKDREGYQSLMSSVSLSNPNRFFIFESTANGNANLFKELWTTAANAVTQVPIFIGWWLHDDYVCKPGSPEYETYWDGKMTDEELSWAPIVQSHYNIKLTPERLAWWRYMYYEKYFEDISTLYQEYPPLPRLAFQFGGSPHISSVALQQRFDEAERETKSTGRFYRVWFGSKFEETSLEEVSSERNYDLVIWEGNRPNRNYVIGVDPAHGMSQFSDETAIEVWAAYADGLEQVAEFSMSGLPAYKATWVLFLLAATYKNCLINIEMAGGGPAMFGQIEQITNQWGSLVPKEFAGYISELQHYHYRRIDSLALGYTARHSVSTQKTRDAMLDYIRDGFEQGYLKIRSTRLVDQAGQFAWDEETGECRVPQKEHDDLVMALGLALVAYQENLLPSLEGTKETLDNAEKTRTLEKTGGLTTSDLLKYRLTDFLEERAKL